MDINRIKEELYKLSLKAYKKNETPVSALIIYKNKIIAKSYNKKNISNNALFHAEILCLQKAYKKMHSWNLNGCEMYVSLEPCDFCKNLIEESRIDKVYYITKKLANAAKYKNTTYEQMYDIEDDLFTNILKKFFKKLRK